MGEASLFETRAKRKGKNKYKNRVNGVKKISNNGPKEHWTCRVKRRTEIVKRG